MQQYATAPVGKRQILCNCNDQFDPHDEGTECFEEGPAAEICPECGKYPWYRIATVQGGSNRTKAKRRQGERKGV